VWSTTELLLACASSLLLLLAARALIDHPRERTAQLSAVLAICVADHLILGPLQARLGTDALAVQLVVIAGLAVPVVFWALARAHFDDDPRWRPEHWAGAAAILAFSYWCWRAEQAAPADERALWHALPKGVGLVVLVHALLNVYVGARADLVVPRLVQRRRVLFVTGSYMLLELFAETLPRSPAAALIAERVHAVGAFGIVALVGVLALRFTPELLRPEPASPGLGAAAPDPELAERFRNAVEVEHAYREDGLTVAGLARRLGVSEHRLREHVNAQLGFRNFNAFLHQHRVAEAARLLADPERRHLGIAQIAFEVGYSSLGPFNRAFKDLTGATPSEFRGRHLPPPATPPPAA